MKKSITKIIIPLILITFFCLPAMTLATEFDPYGEIENVDLGKPDKDEIPNIAVNLINLILGFLALIAMVIIIYSGFTYMFSSGDVEKVKKSKGILIGAVIGLAIILASWGITIYVIQVMNVATAVPVP